MKAARHDLDALPRTYQRLYEWLAPLLGEDRVLCDPLRRLAYGTDASFYRLIPSCW
jgi:D-lactate dehydrogenase